MLDDPVQSILARARPAVLKAITGGGVEGHLCALVLRGERPAWAAGPTAALLASAPPPLLRPHSVAIAGLRAALGVAPPDTGALVEAITRELAREALPPARRAHDDERLMIGIAAGVGACSDLAVPCPFGKRA